jgi:hypothetical protein
VKPIPYAIVSIDLLERILACWESKDENWLVERINDVARRGHSAALKDLPFPSNKSRVTEVFDDLVAKLALSVEH